MSTEQAKTEYRIVSTSYNFSNPCSRCGAISFRVPFEVVDLNSEPLCRMCVSENCSHLGFLLSGYDANSIVIDYTFHSKKFEKLFIKAGIYGDKEYPTQARIAFFQMLCNSMEQENYNSLYWYPFEYIDPADNSILKTTATDGAILKELLIRNLRLSPISLTGIRWLFIQPEPIVIDTFRKVTAAQPFKLWKEASLKINTNWNPMSDLNYAFVGYIGYNKSSNEFVACSDGNSASIMVCDTEEAMQKVIAELDYSNPDNYRFQELPLGQFILGTIHGIPHGLDHKTAHRLRPLLKRAVNIDLLAVLDEAKNDIGFIVCKFEWKEED